MLFRSPCLPGGPIDPLSPGVPVGPGEPLSPGVPVGPGEPTTFVLVKRFGGGLSEIVLVSVLILVGGCDVDFANGTSKTECNEENRSVTTIQTVSRFVIDEGSGLDGEPIVSENKPSFTLRWKLPRHREENCFVLIASSEGLLSVIAI